MFSCLEYTAFLWKAKGRHGTHSPFAYWLVDTVSRQKKRTLSSELVCVKSKKTRFFLAKLQQTLPTYKFTYFADKLPKQRDKSLEAGIYIMSCQQMTYFIDEGRIQLTHPDSIFILEDIRLKENRLRWQRIYKQAFIHFSADCFHFGVISLRPGQAKQHFYLKLA